MATDHDRGGDVGGDHNDNDNGGGERPPSKFEWRPGDVVLLTPKQIAELDEEDDSEEESRGDDDPVH